MTARLTSRLLVQALIRAVEAQGGFAVVVHKGDECAGAIIVQCRNSVEEIRLFERQPDFSRAYVLTPIATQSWGNETELIQYLERRCRSDPDLWVVELDGADAERLAAAIMSQG